MPCCALDNDYFDGSPVRVTVRTGKARKTYRRCECREEIKPGDEYEYYRSLFDGSYATFRTCSPCIEIRDRYFGGSYSPGEMFEHLSECIGSDIEIGDLDGLSPEAAGKLDMYLERFV